MCAGIHVHICVHMHVELENNLGCNALLFERRSLISLDLTR